MICSLILDLEHVENATVEGASPQITSINTISLNTIELIVDQALNAVNAAHIRITSGEHSASLPAAAARFLNEGGTSIITVTLDERNALTSTGDVNIAVEITGDGIVSTYGAYENPIARGTVDVPVRDGIAPAIEKIVYVKPSLIQVYYSEKLAPGSVSDSGPNCFSVIEGTLSSAALSADGGDQVMDLTGTGFKINTVVSYNDAAGVSDNSSRANKASSFTTSEDLTWGESATGFVLKETMVDGLQRKYTVYVPPTYRPDVEWPVILFFHGSGEGGTDGIMPTTVGIGPAIQAHPERYPAIVVFPQQRPGLSVDNLWSASFAKTLEEYTIDRSRMYATGLSAGAYAVWFQGPWLIQHDFAALMPIAGGGNTNDAAALATIPIWAFHGDADTSVPVSESRKMVDAVRAINGDNLNYTEFPGLGHNSWDTVYGNEEYIAWLLRQRLGSGMIE